MNIDSESNWLECVQNPEAVKHIYDVPPTLRRVWLHRIHLEEAGWPCRVVLVTAELPSRPPQRWSDFNTVHIELGMVNIFDLEANGWPWERFVSVTTARSQSGVVFTAIGDGIHLRVKCQGMSVCSLKGSLVEREELRKFR